MSPLESLHINRPSLGLTARMRRRLGAAVTDGFFLGAAKGAGLLPVASPRFHNVAVEKNIAYRPTGRDAHRLDVYRPTNATGPLPIVFYVHGGGFRFMSKDTHWVFGLV